MGMARDPKPMAIAQLEAMVEQGCAVPGCTHKDHDKIFVNQRCHPRGGLDVMYAKGSGKLVIQCHVCDKLVMEISVGLI